MQLPPHFSVSVHFSSIYFSVFLLFFFAVPPAELAIVELHPPQPVFNKFNYLPFDGRGNPSSVHEICGDGLPAAEHLRLTAGPGCSVCSMKL